MTENLKKFDVPTLILHGDDDQIVPIADSALLSSKIVKGAALKVYPGLGRTRVLLAEGDVVGFADLPPDIGIAQTI